MTHKEVIDALLTKVMIQIKHGLLISLMDDAEVESKLIKYDAYVKIGRQRTMSTDDFNALVIKAVSKVIYTFATEQADAAHDDVINIAVHVYASATDSEPDAVRDDIKTLLLDFSEKQKPLQI